MSRLVGELTLRSTRPEGTLDGYVTITTVGSNVTHYHRKWCDLIRRVLSGGEELFLLGQESLGLGNFAVRGEVAARTTSKRRSQGAAD
jgi:hypothetical protein